MFKTIKKYLGLIDEVISDLLGDLKSFRVQLVLGAFGLNFYVLHLINQGKADYKLAAVSLALLTCVYGFYFMSKNKQAELESQVTEADGDPITERDPDLIK